MVFGKLIPSRETLSKTAGFVGGMYLARTYLHDRLEEGKDKLEVDRIARKNLKRRFNQTHHTTSYTILALLPELAAQIMEEMDVEGVTRELQSRSGKGRAVAPAPAPAPPTTTNTTTTGAGSATGAGTEAKPAIGGPEAAEASPSLASSIEVIDAPAGHANLSESLASLQSLNSSLSAFESSTNVNADANPGSPSSNEGAKASLSTMESSILSLPSSIPSGSVSTTEVNVNAVPDASQDKRTKAELWNEVKILTLTRTLTALYTLTLLSLLTTLQLTILARSKYIHSVCLQEKEERIREKLESELTMSNLLFQGLGGGGLLERLGLGNGVGSIEALLSGEFGGFGGEEDGGDEEGDGEGEGEWSWRRRVQIKEETENKYLTLTWWLLHVGCKDVGERVRRGVEEVFDGVSLKTKLSAKDLHRLIGDVRRRVEWEVTFEGVERRVDFLSSLLPSTPETIHHALVQGGFKVPVPPISSLDPTSNDLTSSSGFTGSIVDSFRLNPEDEFEPANVGTSRLATPSYESGNGVETETTMSSSQLSNSQFFTSHHLALGQHHPTSSSASLLSQRSRHSNYSNRSNSNRRNGEGEDEGEEDDGEIRITDARTTPDLYLSSSPYPHISRDAAFLDLIEETRRVIRGLDFGVCLEACLERGVEVLGEGVRRNVFTAGRVAGGGDGDRGVDKGKGKGKEKVESREVEVGPEEEERIRLAGLLPGLARWSSLALNAVPNEMVDNLLAVYEVGALSAIVFGRFQEIVGVNQW